MQMDADLLASFARRVYVTDLDSPEAEEDRIMRWIEAGADPDAPADALEFERWLDAGCPEVDGLTAKDRELLAAAPLTTAQAAKREGVSTRTIARWLDEGRLGDGSEPWHAHKVGSHWRIPQQALDMRRVESAKPKVKPEPHKRKRRRTTTATTAAKPAGKDWWS